MLLWRTPLLLPLLAVAGCIYGEAAGLLLVLASLLAAYLLRLRRLALCSLLCVLVVAMTQSLRHEQAEHLHGLLSTHESVTLQGVITRRVGKSCILETGWTGVRVLLRGDAPWLPGDEVRVTAKSLPIIREPVPGMFSTERWLLGLGVCENLSVLHGQKVRDTWGASRLLRVAEEVRSALSDVLMPPGTEEDARRQVLCALVLGEKERAETETMEVFRRGGCMHAFAVSGLHVGLVAGLLGLLLRLCRVHPSAGRYVLLIGTGLYVFATGLTVPALRAFLMLAALLGGLILRRRSSLFNTWCFAALFILMLQPWQLWQTGFVLSFMVYAGICLGVSFCMRNRPWFGPDDYIPTRIRTLPERLLVVAELCVRGTVVVSLCAWLVSAPLSIYFFHVVTPTSFLTNIAIAPLLPVVMLAGLLALALSWVPLLGMASQWCAQQAAGWLISLVALMGSHPVAYLPAHAPASPDSYMIVATGRYNKSFCVLGNPGILLGDTGRADDAYYSIEPALFHAGYRPALWCCAAPAREAAELYKRSFPDMQLMEHRSAEHTVRITGSAGEFVLYYPDHGLAGVPASREEPIVLWRTPRGERIMYIGTTTPGITDSLPPEEKDVDILILGGNPSAPQPEPELLKRLAPHRVILLPSAYQLDMPKGPMAPLYTERLHAERHPIIRRGE